MLRNEPPTALVTPTIFGTFGGAFVTFWAPGKTLRGCVGSFATTSDLEQTVQNVTEASLQDPRFESAPILPEELDEMVIEVSVLSPLERANPGAPEWSAPPGVHGVWIRKGRASGCFLPKVAVEHGWSMEEFLSQCCTLKAKLPADAWRDPSTEVFLFTAEAFSEDQFAAAGQTHR